MYVYLVSAFSLVFHICIFPPFLSSSNLSAFACEQNHSFNSRSEYLSVFPVPWTEALETAGDSKCRSAQGATVAHTAKHWQTRVFAHTVQKGLSRYLSCRGVKELLLESFNNGEELPTLIPGTC